MKMKIFAIVCILFCQLRAWSQQKDRWAYSDYSVTQISKDSSFLNIRIVIINSDSIEYYYPKAFEQEKNGRHLYCSLENSKYRQHQNLSFDVGAWGVNSYDTLIAIPPSDSLIIEYKGIKLKGPMKIEAQHYISPSKDAIKQVNDRIKYFNPYLRGVKIIEFELAYSGKKIRQKTTTRNAITR